MEQNAHAYLWVAIFFHMTTFKIKVITTTHNAKENFENQENVTDMQLSNMSMQMGWPKYLHGQMIPLQWPFSLVLW